MAFNYRDILKSWDEQKPNGRSGKSFWMAVKIAIEKQIPQKPRIETTKEVPTTHNLGKTLYFFCPRCGRFIVGIYETDPKRGGGIHSMLNGCSSCLQAIDFSEWKHKDSEEELDLEE